MNSRIIYINGKSSELPIGDPERDDRRFIFKDENGDEVLSTIPVLLSEGWKIDSIVNLGSPHNLAIAILSKDSQE